MPTELVWKGEPPEGWSEYLGGDVEAGWAFYAPADTARLSVRYLGHVAPVRRPIIVIIPSRLGPGRVTSFCIDGHPTSDPGAAWQVTVDVLSLVEGEKPDITVYPSIHCVGDYHGWLTNGVLSDDIGH